MTLSQNKIIRGLQKISYGLLPDAFYPAAQWLREANWKRLTSGKSDFIKIKLDKHAKLHLPKHSSLAKYLVCNQFEKGERLLLTRVLKPGGIFIDIGANVGMFTVIAGTILRGAGKVIAIEPSSTTCEELKRQIELNDLSNVIVVNAGVSSSDGSLILHENQTGVDAFNSFGKPVIEATFSKHEVPVYTLDSIINSHACKERIHLVKIDTEGWESHVLIGGSGCFRTVEAPDIIIEFCQPALQRAGTSCHQVFEQLLDYGYQIYLINSENGWLTKQEIPKQYEYANLFATKRDCSSWGV